MTAAYVDLRTWAVRSGHGLGAKDHEADRWVAAVAMAAKLPLATEDSIFDGVAGLTRADPETGRMPAEGQALLDWMLANEKVWRLESLDDARQT
ncbi:MAG: hypothetical protein ACR2G7_00310 [Acidimicrobiales bacterium]